VADIFVILYELPVYNRPELWPRLLWNRATDEGAWPFNSHFIAQFQPTVLARPTFPQPTDVGIPPADVPVNFIAKFQPTQFNIRIFPQPADAPPVPPTAETNQHLIAGFRPTLWQQQYLWSPNSDIPIPPADVPTYFIAKYSPYQWPQPIFPQPTDGTAVIPPADNPQNFIARFQPLVFQRLVFPWPTDVAIPAADVPVYVLARYNQPVYFLDRNLLQNVPSDVPAAVVQPTDVQHIWGFSIIRKPL